jgi:signal transduction histidine kinase
MAIRKRSSSLKIVFLEYLFAIALMLVLALVIPYSLFSIGMSTGLYTYANSSEVQAKNMEPKIATTKPFDSKLIPASCTYVYVSVNYIVLQSNMDKSEMENAISYAEGKYSPATPDDCYLSIKREDGICILHYYIGSRYTVGWMNSTLPNINKLLVVVCIANCLVGCFIVTTLFAKHLRKQLQPLMDATQKIKEKDLDFEIRPSGIQEFNHILLSISDMKSELKLSLEQQWRMEQTKKEQTSALAHDIKTPLTIIRGNAELLGDSQLTDEQQKYTNYILKNAARMERYLKMLINLTQVEAGYSVDLQKIDTKRFVKGLEDQANGLATAKQLEVALIQKDLPQEFTADSDLLGRAIMNVVSNAVDYSPEHGKISISAEAVGKHMIFCIVDSGKGFSQEDLKNATSQFYMGDKNRSADTHFGIGLSITDAIIKLHHGSLKVENSTETGGGRVTIKIPLQVKTTSMTEMRRI